MWEKSLKTDGRENLYKLITFKTQSEVPLEIEIGPVIRIFNIDTQNTSCESFQWETCSFSEKLFLPSLKIDFVKCDEWSRSEANMNSCSVEITQEGWSQNLDSVSSLISYWQSWSLTFKNSHSPVVDNEKTIFNIFSWIWIVSEMIWEKESH